MSAESGDRNVYAEIRAALDAQGEVIDTVQGTRAACPVHNGTDVNNFSLYPSGAGRCWSQCNRTFSPVEMARILSLEIPTIHGISVKDYLAEFSLSPSSSWMSSVFGLKNVGVNPV